MEMWFASFKTLFRCAHLLCLFISSPTYFPFFHSFSLPMLRPASPSPAVYLLTLTVCAVNNWWSSLTQRVTGPGENVSPISLFIYKSIFKFSWSEKPPQVFIVACESMGGSSPTASVVRFVATSAPVTMSGLMLAVWLTAGQREEREA